jgi:hypothetical protein
MTIGGPVILEGGGVVEEGELEEDVVTVQLGLVIVVVKQVVTSPLSSSSVMQPA